MLVRSDPHEEQERVGVAIADLGLQASVCESLTKLLELGGGLGLVCVSVSPLLHSPRPADQHTRVGKAVANHIIDVEVALQGR